MFYSSCLCSHVESKEKTFPAIKEAQNLVVKKNPSMSVAPQEGATKSRVEIYTKKEDDVQVQKPTDKGSSD